MEKNILIGVYNVNIESEEFLNSKGYFLTNDVEFPITKVELRETSSRKVNIPFLSVGESEVLKDKGKAFLTFKKDFNAESVIESEDLVPTTKNCKDINNCLVCSANCEDRINEPNSYYQCMQNTYDDYEQ